MTPTLSQSPAVVAALDWELAYIEALPRRVTDSTVAGQLTTLRVLGIKADEAWYDNAGEEEALDMIRKIAGTAIRALILFGCPERQVAQDNQELILAMRAQMGSDEQKDAAATQLAVYRETKALDRAAAAMEAGGFMVDRASLEAVLQSLKDETPTLKIAEAT